jgi:hypothetical protein
MIGTRRGPGTVLGSRRRAPLDVRFEPAAPR